MVVYPDSVERALRDDQAPTPPLADFLRVYAEDPSVYWRLSSGHHQNLLDEAVDLLFDLGWRP